jgi:hypothetical protein
VLLLGPASISFSTLTISTTSASMLKSDSAVRPTLTFPRNIVDFTQPHEIRDCLREPAQSTQGRRADAN